MYRKELHYSLRGMALFSSEMLTFGDRRNGRVCLKMVQYERYAEQYQRYSTAFLVFPEIYYSVIT